MRYIPSKSMVAKYTKGQSGATESLRLQKIVMDVHMRREGGTIDGKFVNAKKCRYLADIFLSEHPVV